MLLLFYTTCICFLLLSLRWYFSIYFTHRWLKKEILPNTSAGRPGAAFLVLIPVLAETGRIEETVKYFIGTFGHTINLRLILITTENEFFYQPTSPNTIDIAKSLSKKYGDLVHHCHYPRMDGRMSHQLNYCIKSCSNLVSDDTMLAVYNADSRPHPLTFSWVASKVQADKTLQVFQQYGDYTRNLNSKTNSILVSASLWQNRWAVGFELFKAIQSFKSYKNKIFRPLNYLIGHGLFLTKNTYDRSVGFSESFHNEDAILGLEMSFVRQKITPIPYFDISDTPDTIMSLYRQKIHWFFGPFQAFRYFHFLNNKYKNYSFKEHGILFFLSFKLFLHAVYWVCGPFFIFTILVIPIVNRDFLLFLIAYFVFLMYFTLPNLLSLNLFTPRRTQRKPLFLVFSLAWGGIICYFLHGLSAVTAIILSIYRFVTGKPITKGKTIMKKI